MALLAELAGYLNCPQNLKWVGPQGNCTALLLEDVSFPGAKGYECAGALGGDSHRCVPPTCHLNSTTAVMAMAMAGQQPLPMTRQPPREAARPEAQ